MKANSGIKANSRIDRAAELQEKAWALQAAGNLQGARKACRTALHLAEMFAGPESADAANLLNDLAEIECERASYRKALAYADRASRIRAPGQVRRKTHEILGTLNRILHDYPVAETHLKRALALSRSATDIATAQNNLGVLYKYSARYSEGLRLYKQALKTMTELFGAESLEVGTIYHNIGGILHARGDFKAAEAPARRAWDISRWNLGENHPATLLDAAAYAAVLVDRDRYAEAEAIYRRALVIFTRAYGPRHYEIAVTHHCLGVALSAQKRLAAARRHYRLALKIKRHLLGPHHPETRQTLEALSRSTGLTQRSKRCGNES